MSGKTLLVVVVLVAAFGVQNACTVANASFMEVKNSNGEVLGAVDSGGKSNQIENALPNILKRPRATLKKPEVPIAPRSLLQACRKEIPVICPEKKAIVKCLTAKADQIQDADCKTWVVSRDSCTKAATKHSGCTPRDSPRQCLRKVPEADLPEECSKSDFYKSVKTYSMFRRNPGEFKANLLGNTV